jgi:hypothetical protein
MGAHHETTAVTPEFCDRCGVQGQILYELPSHLSLVFCGHHDREFGMTLVLQGATPYVTTT